MALFKMELTVSQSNSENSVNGISVGSPLKQPVTVILSS